MRWEVRGANRKTGDDMVTTINARTQADAERIARSEGMLVSSIELADDDGVVVASRNPMLGPSSHAPPAPHTVHVQHSMPAVLEVRTKGASPLGVAGLVIGIIAILGSWIPLVGLLTLPLAVIAIIVSALGFIIALVGRRSGVGFPVAGVLLGTMSIVIAIASTGGVVASIADSAVQATESNQIIASGDRRGQSAEWVTATESVQQGDIEVKVLSVKVGSVPLKYLGDDTTSAEPELVVHIQIANRSETKKIDYFTWRDRNLFSQERSARLSDNFGNNYSQKYASSSSFTVVGAVAGYKSLHPGGHVRDVLVFEKPVQKAEYLQLELPAKSFDGSGFLRFRIPAAMIKRSID